MATKKSSSTKRKTAKGKSEQALEVSFRKGFLELENDVSLAKELVQQCEFLLRGMVQDFGVDNEGVAKVILIGCALEKAERTLGEFVENLCGLNAALGKAGVEVTESEAANA